MIEYTKLFDLLEIRGMKKTDLLNIMSSQTLAKLGKGATIQTDIIDKICLYLGVQPSDIMEVYEIHEKDGEKIKIKVRGESNLGKDISYGTKQGLTGLTASDLRNLVTEEGYIDLKKLDEILES